MGNFRFGSGDRVRVRIRDSVYAALCGIAYRDAYLCSFVGSESTRCVVELIDQPGVRYVIDISEVDFLEEESYV